eukprot:g46543.t1
MSGRKRAAERPSSPSHSCHDLLAALLVEEKGTTSRSHSVRIHPLAGGPRQADRKEKESKQLSSLDANSVVTRAWNELQQEKRMNSSLSLRSQQKQEPEGLLSLASLDGILMHRISTAPGGVSEL